MLGSTLFISLYTLSVIAVGVTRTLSDPSLLFIHPFILASGENRLIFFYHIFVSDVLTHNLLLLSSLEPRSSSDLCKMSDVLNF